MKQTPLQMLIVTALFTAIIGILAQVTIPLPLVPITGQTLAIGLAATILGSRYGTISAILYLIIGAIGIPVFSQMQSGLGVILDLPEALLSDSYLPFILSGNTLKNLDLLF